MISTRVLSALAFPWFIYDAHGNEISSGPGSLFELPRAAQSPDSVQYLRSIKRPGWSTCPNGYAAYARALDPSGIPLLIIPGLKVNGVSRAYGTEPGLAIKTSAAHFERHVENILKASADVDEEYSTIVTQNIHEIRGMNGRLYHAAFNAEQKLLRAMPDTMEHKLIRNVVALSEILSTRIDYIDFISNPVGVKAGCEFISVFRKFDKMNRCFKAAAFAERKVQLDFRGSSDGHVFGPPIFDIIPYLLLDNAVKYSPAGNEITVSVRDENGMICCDVSSLGPRIENDELDQIFNPSFRGKHARNTGRPGTGMGLPVLKRLTENVFLGNINVNVGKTLTDMNGIPYCAISFELRFPRAVAS